MARQVQLDDFKRADRQQKVLLEMRKHFAEMDLFFDLPGALEAIGATVKTDFPRDKAGDLASLLPLITGPDIRRLVLDLPRFVDPPRTRWRTTSSSPGEMTCASRCGGCSGARTWRAGTSPRTMRGRTPSRTTVECVVGAARFERATSCSQSRCATRLRYAPTATFRTGRIPQPLTARPDPGCPGTSATGRPRPRSAPTARPAAAPRGCGRARPRWPSSWRIVTGPSVGCRPSRVSSGSPSSMASRSARLRRRSMPKRSTTPSVPIPRVALRLVSVVDGREGLRRSHLADHVGAHHPVGLLHVGQVAGHLVGAPLRVRGLGGQPVRRQAAGERAQDRWRAAQRLARLVELEGHGQIEHSPARSAGLHLVPQLVLGIGDRSASTWPRDAARASTRS